MILVDTSIWIDHLRCGDSRLVDLLERSRVVVHPFVVGEIACGFLAHRQSVHELLQELPAAVRAEDDEVLLFIERHSPDGKGIEYIDANLLASTALTAQAKLWTRDKKLGLVAEALGLSFEGTGHGAIAEKVTGPLHRAAHFDEIPHD